MNDFETLKAEYDKRCIEIIYLKESARKSADEAASALDLLSRVRFALGDNGVRMQDELIAYCAELRDAMALSKQALDERDHYIKDRDQLRDALIWCSGSADFGPGGKAETGWNKVCRPLIGSYR